VSSRRTVLLGLGRELLLVVVVAALGFFAAGLTGALVAGAAVIAGRLPSERPGASVAMASFVLLAAAAVASVLEAVPGERPLTLAFPLQRELAGDLGAAAGILLLAAVVTSALAERADEPAPTSTHEDGDTMPPWRPLVTVGGLFVVAFVIRLVAAPAAVASSVDPVVEAVAAGQALVVGDLGLVAPAAPVLAAFWPGGGSAAVVALGVVLAAISALLATRLVAPEEPSEARTAGVVAVAAVAAMLPSLWLLDLAGLLAGLAAAAAVLLAEPRRATPGRGVGAGVVAGLAVLAAPEAVVLGPLLVVWLLLPRVRRGRVARRPARRQVRAAWATGLAWGVALVLWALVVHEQAGGWNPLRSPGPASEVSVGAGGLLLVLALDAAAVVAAVVWVWGRRRSVRALLPLVVLPVWCLLAGALVSGGVVSGGAAGPLGWGSPFVAVLAGWQLAAWSGAPLRRFLDHEGTAGQDQVGQVEARTSS